jgi:uncharacterized membrane protein
MDKGAKITGLLVFVAGVAMLIAVFVVALNMLNHSQATQITDIARQLPSEGFGLLARVLFLFVLGYIASSVAARGIQMFESCAPESGEVVTKQRIVQTKEPAREE